MKKIIFAAFMLTLMLFFSSCSIISDAQNTATDQRSDGSISSDNTETKPLSKVELLLKSMTLEEKIGQLFIIRPEALQSKLSPEQVNHTLNYGVIEFDKEMSETLKQYPVGGVVLFGKNISTPVQVTTFIDAMQKQTAIPLFVATDEEGGSVSRIANSSKIDVPKFYSMQEIGKTNHSQNARQVGLTIGSYLKQYGFNLDFAPVVDVNTNPQNNAIGNRSFGNDPQLVAGMISAEISGLRDSSIISCVKHFPGHGDTKGDTHVGFVAIEKNWEELKECELIPFIKAISIPTDMIMISHITTPNVTSDNLPASLSYKMIEEKLRKELDYSGVVITDSMAMGAITQNYSSDDCAVRAILAGVDIILMPENFTEAYNGIYYAVKNNTISEERIDESVLRILSLKEQYNLLK